MSDTTIASQGADLPIAIQPEAIAKAVAETTKQAPKVESDPKVDMTPAQLKARLDEERVKGEKRAAESLAIELGVSVADAKRIIAEAKAKDDAQKSEVQRLTEQNAAKDAQLKELAAYKSAVEGRATYEFALLDDAQRTAVEKLAGNDSAKRLVTIDALRPTWAAAKASADAEAQARAAAVKAAEEAAKAAAAPPKIPAPASTTPAAPPPPPTQPGQPTNHRAVYDHLKQSNPAAAGKYRLLHSDAFLASPDQKAG